MKSRTLAILGMAIGLGLIAAKTTLADEVRAVIGSDAFAPQLVPTGQNFEVYKFALPDIPKGSRIDFAGLVFHIQRDSTRDEYLSLKLVPVTSSWTPSSVKNGQMLSLDETEPSYAVADAAQGDRAELDITNLATAWYRGEKINSGFYLTVEDSEDQTNLSVKSNGGAKMELVIYYTGPEVKK